MDPNAQNPAPAVPADPNAGVQTPPAPVVTPPVEEPVATPTPEPQVPEQPVVPVIPTEGTGDAGTGMPTTTPPSV